MKLELTYTVGFSNTMLGVSADVEFLGGTFELFNEAVDVPALNFNVNNEDNPILLVDFN